MKEEQIVEIIYLLLILLFGYTAVSKLADFNDFRSQMSKQVFSAPVREILLYTLPAIEILTATLLISPRFRLTGLVLSSALMLLFTGYIILILSGYYKSIPCVCGGVLKMLNWRAHLWFNVFFLVLAVLGSIFQYQIKSGGKVTT
jgi:putative oxidoreductase